MGILSHHVPTIVQLKPGVVEIITEGQSGEKYFGMSLSLFPYPPYRVSLPPISFPRPFPYLSLICLSCVLYFSSILSPSILFSRLPVWFSFVCDLHSIFLSPYLAVAASNIYSERRLCNRPTRQSPLHQRGRSILPRRLLPRSSTIEFSRSTESCKWQWQWGGSRWGKNWTWSLWSFAGKSLKKWLHAPRRMTKRHRTVIARGFAFLGFSPMWLVHATWFLEIQLMSRPLE